MPPIPSVGLDVNAKLDDMRHRLVDCVHQTAEVLSLVYVPVLAWRVQQVGRHEQLQGMQR